MPSAAPPFPRVSVGLFAVPGAALFPVAAGLRFWSWHHSGWRWFGLCGMVLLTAAAALAMSGGSPSVQRIEARLRRWFRPPRRLSFTREGKYFVGITFGVGFAAINTGNNLLYLLLGMMLSLIIASGLLSEMSLRGIEVSRRPPGRLNAGRPFLMGIALKNGKRRLPSFSVEVEDLVDGKPLDKKCYFLKVPSGRRQQTSYRHTVARRGRYAFTGFRLSTRFPFALFCKSRVVTDAAEVIVLPLVFPIPQPPPSVTGLVGDRAQGKRSRRGDFHGLREYRDGDDPRDVHWRSTARKGHPMVREHEDEAARRVTLFLDNALPGGALCVDPLLLAAFERAVSLAASLATWYLEHGFALRLVARGEALPWATNPAQLMRVLRALALLPAVDETTPFAASSERGVESLYVARRGAARASGMGRLVEA